MEDLELREAGGADISAMDLYAAVKLRSEVFVVEQACAYLEPDGRDLESTTRHLWLRTSAGSMASYLRVLTEADGTCRIGRVVTSPQHRGRRLSGHLIDVALTTTPRPVVLDAQSHLVGIYARHGFTVDGPEYLEDDIPHTPMRLVAR